MRAFSLTVGEKKLQGSILKGWVSFIPKEN